MEEILMDAAAELISFVVYGILAAVFGYAGFVWEEVGISSLLSGDMVMGLWYVYMGSLALYVGIYLIGYREIPARILALQTKVTT